MKRFERRLQSLVSRQGGVVAVLGDGGSGRSRLLDEFSLQAKLSGRVVLRCDAQAAGLKRWGGAGVLMAQLQSQLPELSARQLLPHATVLRAVLHETSARDSLPLAPVASVERATSTSRADIQTALREVMFGCALQRELVLVIDDLDRLDEPSAAFIALLAHSVSQHPMLIIGSADADAADSGDQPALRLLMSVADKVALSNLSFTSVRGAGPLAVRRCCQRSVAGQSDLRSDARQPGSSDDRCSALGDLWCLQLRSRRLDPAIQARR
jgi:hypothetical protein